MEEQSTRRKERKKERITGNKKNIKVKNKKSHHYMMTFNKIRHTLLSDKVHRIQFVYIHYVQRRHFHNTPIIFVIFCPFLLLAYIC